MTDSWPLNIALDLGGALRALAAAGHPRAGELLAAAAQLDLTPVPESRSARLKYIKEVWAPLYRLYSDARAEPPGDMPVAKRGRREASR